MERLNRVVVVAVLALVLTGTLSWAASADQASSSAIERTFQEAKRNYLEKNWNAAADEIQKGAAYLKSEAAKAVGKGKEALTASAEELEKTAAVVKRGALDSEKEMEAAFARAYHALAENANLKSAESWGQKQTGKAGEALDESMAYLERGWAWAGEKIEVGTKEAIVKSRELAKKLKEKTGSVAAEVGKGLAEAGAEIEKFGLKMHEK